MNTERLIHIPQCSTIDLSALCNPSSSIWKTIESHRWVKLSYENIGMCLSYVPFTLVIRLINCWDFIQIWYDNKMLSSQWDYDNQHFVYIIVSRYLLGIITHQSFLFSCSCMNMCTCLYLKHDNNLSRWFYCHSIWLLSYWSFVERNVEHLTLGHKQLLVSSLFIFFQCLILFFSFYYPLKLNACFREHWFS